MADEVILLDFLHSPFGMRVRIALAEKRVAFERREENLSNKSDFLLKANPVHGKVPVLIHNGKPVCESLVIVQYIDEAWKDKSPPLLPSDPYERAKARFWADFVDKKIYEIQRRLGWGPLKDRAIAKNELIECLKVLEVELGEKTYFGGESFNIVDIAFVPFSARFYAYETFGNFSMAVECPRLVRWVQRCMQKESVAKSLPTQQASYEYLLEREKQLGVL
ncbi:probable glutathione S-transferase [Malania oleifera]|uniref:probable glutathione S-transferase n=1 Tax=Malania oleifera TaxID=397392 RepID=UPI0025AE3E7C|nr:probable glutathione S-transferase [Malania oleifera]